MKRTVEISHAELIELLKKALNIGTPAQCIGLSAHCNDTRDLGYGMLNVQSISLSWDEGKADRSDVYDR
jgi:hypothetical protein